MQFHIDKSSSEPLYLQLANQLIDAIENQICVHKQRLPTEDQLVTLLDISKGTVKSAYAYMEALGYVRKIRGSGVYVDKVPTEKSNSQLIIDNFFKNFDEQNDVSCTQGYLVFKDKLDEAFSLGTKLHVAVVDSSKEMLHSISNQLSSFDDISTVSYVASDLFSGERAINPLCKLMVASKKYCDIMARYTAALHIRTEQIMWCESNKTVASICKIPQDKSIGIIYMSDGFLSAVVDTLHNLQISNKIIPIKESDTPRSIDKLGNLSLIVADNHSELYCAKSLEFIEKLRKHGSDIIPFVCEIDNGSMQNLRDRIQELASTARRHGI